MQCLYPVGILLPDKRAMYVPCGQCMACRINRAQDWALRLWIESRQYSDLCFVTLTYNDENCSGSLCKRDLQLFNKRLRKARSFRFFACGEYGSSTRRPHYHMIVFGIGVDDSVWKGKRYDSRSHGWYCQCDFWPFGHVYLGEVTPQSIAYVCKYTTKAVFGKGAVSAYDELCLERPFNTMSRRPGIGSFVSRDYVESHNWYHFKDMDRYNKLPRYYVNKFYPAGSEERSLRTERLSSIASRCDFELPASSNFYALSRSRSLELARSMELKHDRSRC